jgi:cytochrome c556
MENAMNHPKHRAVPAITLVVALLVPAAIFHAQAAEPAKPMALQNVMAKLGRDMQAVTGAISTEDWALVARLAPNIAHHPEPPLPERARILAWLGTDAGKFRSFDGQVHEAAAAMSEAAKQGDGKAVIARFAEVQRGCLACHQNFRKPFVEHFYGQR